MKGASKVIMGATVVMVVSLAVVLGLVLLLLAELYCTLLLRRRQLQSAPDNTTTTATALITTNTTSAPTTNTPSSQNHSPSPLPPLASYYAHGVLRAPRKLLFPAISSKETKVTETDHHQHNQLHHILQVHTEESNRSPQQVGLITTSPSNLSFATSPPLGEIPNEISGSNVCNNNCSTGSGEHFVYISNPIYDNEASRPSRTDTPFETPDSSPSHLKTGNSSDDEEIDHQSSPSSPKTLLVSVTPPLTPMKKLPAEACSVSLRDARSLATSGSDTVSNHGLSSSSSGTPCTSPSW